MGSSQGSTALQSFTGSPEDAAQEDSWPAQAQATHTQGWETVAKVRTRVKRFQEGMHEKAHPPFPFPSIHRRTDHLPPGYSVPVVG